MKAPRVLLAVMLACLGLVPVALPAGAAPSGAPTVAAGWTPRGEQYPGTKKQLDLSIPMDDGVTLKADLIQPADANGAVVPGRRPVIVMITAYNKAVIGQAGGLGGVPPDFLVKRGYNYLIVDARGTGSSGGTWQVLGPREQKDYGLALEWTARQPWSDGRTGMNGPSYMGISQLFAAGREPRGLKAIFPQVPSAEVYRDTAASGGQVDVGFIPLWLGLVSVTSLIPSPGTTDPMVALAQVLGHLSGTGGTSLELALNALASGDRAYDGPWYQDRSTLLQAVPHINVPTFLVGGHYDLFQRGTPLVFQALKKRGVPVKMILGPWDHLDGSSGAGIGEAGYGSLNDLQLRWFDHYVKGVPDATLDQDIPDFTYYELGSGTWKRRDSYLSDQVARVFRLSGTATTAAGHGALTEGAVTAGTSTVLPLAAGGLCSRSATQWTAGLSNTLLPDNPCNHDNTLNDMTGVVFETAPLKKPLRMLGPISARLFTSSTTGDGLLSVHVSRVDPGGQVERLTGGWQVISLAALDRSKSVTLPQTTDTWTGARSSSPTQIVQPWHPFTKASQRVRRPGEVSQVDVEVFPTGAVIPAGQRLRVSVNAFDLPHLAPTLTQLPSIGSVLTIHNSQQYPSQLVVPTWGSRVITDPGPTQPAESPSPSPSPSNHPTGGGGTTHGPQAAAAPAASQGPGQDLPETGAPAGLWDLGALGLALLLAGHTLIRRAEARLRR